MSERTEIDDIQRRVVAIESLLQTLLNTVNALAANVATVAAFSPVINDTDSLVNKIWDEIKPAIAVSATLENVPNP